MSATPSKAMDASLLQAAENVSAVMEEVRLDACGARPMNHLWAMDTLHDLRDYLYKLRLQLRNAA